METIELKFLLKLLSKQGYRAPIKEVNPNSKTLASERDRICRKLCDRELVGYSSEICKFKIAPPGKELLQSNTDNLTSEELKILKACEKQTITPRKTGISAADVQTVLQALEDKGLIQVSKKDKKIKEVWLTEQGEDYLLHEYDPRGAGNITLTKTMVADYLRFCRQSLSSYQGEVSETAPVYQREAIHKPSDKEILQTIDDLDWKLRTKNRLPIYYVREKLQPPLSREELDEALYRLEKSGKIELKAMTEGWRYSRQDFNAGIPQRAGSRLFFVTLK